MSEQLPLQFEFNANQSFNSFFPGCNQEVSNHLKQCASGQGEQQILIWGDTGVGKSHLLQACCQLAHQHNLTTFYFSFDPKNLADPGILNGIDELDLVCLDNIEAIAGNPDWELAVFNFFNRHRDNDHFLIMSASSQAKYIPIQLPDLKTRLNWGLTLKLKTFEQDELLQALTYKAKQLGFELSPQVGRFLLKHYADQQASLWALLEKLDHATLAAKRKLTIPFVKKVLNEFNDR